MAAVERDVSSSEAAAAADLSVGRPSALHTILCFLVSVNAEATAVEEFVTENPEALLLEGTALLPEEAAIRIVDAQLAKCLISSSSSSSLYGKDNAPAKNMLRLRSMIQKGFIFFKERQRNRTRTPGVICDSFSLLVHWEVKIMAWRKAERRIRAQMLEESATAARYLPSCSTCVGADFRVDPIGGMHYVKEQHAELVCHIRRGRQKQYKMLKLAFADMPRFHHGEA